MILCLILVGQICLVTFHTCSHRTLLKFFVNMMMGDRSLEEPKAEKPTKGPMALPVGPIALAQAQAQAQAQAGIAVNGTAVVPPTELEIGPSPVIGSTPPADTQDASMSVMGRGDGGGALLFLFCVQSQIHISIYYTCLLASDKQIYIIIYIIPCTRVPRSST